MTGLARLRDRVERPPDGAGARVVGAHVPGRRGPRALVDARAEDEQIAVDGPRGRGEDEEGGGVAPEPLAQVHATARPEAGHERPGARVEGEEVLARAVQDPALGSLAPDDDAAVHAEGTILGPGRERVEPPELAARLGVERERLEAGRRSVEDAVHHHRVALDLRAVVGARVAGVVRPGDLQPLHVAGVDLRERRVLRVAGVAAVDPPLALGRDAGGGVGGGPEDRGEGERGGDERHHGTGRRRLAHGSRA